MQRVRPSEWEDLGIVAGEIGPDVLRYARKRFSTLLERSVTSCDTGTILRPPPFRFLGMKTFGICSDRLSQLSVKFLRGESVKRQENRG